MINITELVEKYNKLADAFDDSIATVQTSPNHAAQRDEWIWYLKGQQLAYRNVALHLRNIQLTELLGSQSETDPIIATKPFRPKLPG